MRASPLPLALILAVVACAGCGTGGNDNHPDAIPGKTGSSNHRTAPSEDGSTAGESDGRTARPGGQPATPTPAPAPAH